MTISTSLRSVDYPGNGSTTAFTVPFPFQSSADLSVKLVDSLTLAETAWVITTDYTVTGGDPTGTLTAVVAPASGKTLHIERVVSYAQSLDLTANDALPAESLEDALDRIVMMVQQIADGGGGGSSGGVDLVNIGSGAGIVSGLVGSSWQMRSIVAGSNVTVTQNANDVTIAASAPGETNTASNLGAGNGVFASKSGVDLRFKSLVAGTNITLTPTGNDITIAATSGVAGETNTISSTGATGNSLVQTTSKVGVDLRVRGLIAGSNVTITNSGGTDWTIAATGEANTASNIGVAGAGLWASKSGVDLRFKGLAVGTGLSQSTNATDITHSINQAAALTWTAVETFNRQASRTSPSVVFKSLGVGDVVDGSVLLASDYVALADFRKTTDVATEGPVDSSWGGNFCAYMQHHISGTAGVNGFAGGGIRAAVDATFTGNASGPTNDPIAGYFSIRNAGTRLGAFGVHVDAFHNGTATGSHTTYGSSIELWKEVSGGVAATYVGRSQSTQAVDFGLVLTHLSSAGFKRGIQLGSPAFASGGLAGAPGSATAFDVGIDLTWGSYAYAAMQIKSNDYITLSGVAQAQSATPNSDCYFRYRTDRSDFSVEGGGVQAFGVAPATGRVRLCEPTATTVGAAGGASALPATPLRYLTVLINTGATIGAPTFTAVKIPCYNV